MNNTAGKRLYLLLEPPDARSTGRKPRVLGPYRIIEVCSDGVFASPSFLRPEQLASVNGAGRYVLAADGTEWESARVVDVSEPMTRKR
jgi:hypothetical protein